MSGSRGRESDRVENPCCDQAASSLIHPWPNSMLDQRFQSGPASRVPTHQNPCLFLVGKNHFQCLVSSSKPMVYKFSKSVRFGHTSSSLSPQETLIMAAPEPLLALSLSELKATDFMFSEKHTKTWNFIDKGGKPRAGSKYFISSRASARALWLKMSRVSQVFKLPLRISSAGLCLSR